MDDGYETGTTTAPSSATSGKSRSPQRSSSLSSAAPAPLVLSKRSVGSGSLPSPAHITDEARRVLEAFLQRSLSIDRGSTSSVAAMLPRHLEVIEEIRHTRIRSRSYRAAHGDEAAAEDAVDGVTVTVAAQGAETIASVQLEHHHAEERHSTDIDVRLAGEDGVERVLHTRVLHPPISAAAAVTTGAAEVFMDASLSRQASEMETGDRRLSVTEDAVADTRPSTANYEADLERAQSVDKRKKRKKLSRESIRTWLRTTLRSRREEEILPSPEEEERPRYFTMESSSSTTSTSTFAGAPARSVVHRGLSEERPKRKKRRLRRRTPREKASAEGTSFFHQLFRLKLPKLFHASEPNMAQPSLSHRNSEIIADMLAAQQAAERTPDAEAASMPDLLSREERQREVGEMFRCAIEKRNSGASGLCVEANAVVRTGAGDAVDAGVVKQVDRTTLRLDLGSSSNSSTGQSGGSSGGMQLSSPDQLGPDGVASKRDVDKVARLLDKLADEINLTFSQGRDRTESTLSAPPTGARDKRRHSLPDNSPSKSPSVSDAVCEEEQPGADQDGTRRSRPGSARTRNNKSESSEVAGVATSSSTPLLGDVNGDEFDPQRALRAKAQRIKHQSVECIVSGDVLERLLACGAYEEFSAVLRAWYGSGPVNWKQIALLYHLTRKLVRQVSRGEESEERVAAIKNFTMKFFHDYFAEFVIRRGGWQNVIEDTEDSELD